MSDTASGTTLHIQVVSAFSDICDPLKETALEYLPDRAGRIVVSAGLTPSLASGERRIVLYEGAHQSLIRAFEAGLSPAAVLEQWQQGIIETLGIWRQARSSTDLIEASGLVTHTGAWAFAFAAHYGFEPTTQAPQKVSAQDADMAPLYGILATGLVQNTPQVARLVQELEAASLQLTNAPHAGDDMPYLSRIEAVLAQGPQRLATLSQAFDVQKAHIEYLTRTAQAEVARAEAEQKLLAEETALVLEEQDLLRQLNLQQQATLEDSERQRGQLEQAHHDLLQQRHHLEETVHQQERELQAFHNSTFWRMTYPARASVNFMRARRRKPEPPALPPPDREP